MKHLMLVLTLGLSFSCTSRSQEKGRILSQTSDSLSVSTAHKKAFSDTLSLLFVGDLMQHQEQINAAKTAHGYDYSSYFTHLQSTIEKADLAIGNLEVTLGGKPYRGYPAFSAPDEYAQAIQAAGFDLLLTANNHCLDRGKKGLERTIRQLDTLGIPHTGTFIDASKRADTYPLIIEKKGIKIAFLNYTYATNGIRVTPPNEVNYIDTTRIAKDISKAQLLGLDVIIACMHWGDEYQSLPNQTQQRLANWLFGKGVHHIIGSHPHVVQPLEVRTDSATNQKKLLVYSLGNFISNMSARRTNGGLIVRMQLVKESTVRMVQCDYGLVFVGRPAQTRKKNFTLYPIEMPVDSIPVNIRNSLNIFKKDSRKLFRDFNSGIKETFF